MAARNQTAAVIGAGDYIGSAIAKKFSAEGFTLFVGRRNGDKLRPLVQEIEGEGGRAANAATCAGDEYRAAFETFRHSPTQRERTIAAL